MPFIRRPFRRRFTRRPYRRRIPGLATRPRMMSKALTVKRMNQVSTRVFWFKKNGVISPDAQGRIYSFWTARGFNNPPGTPPPDPPVGWPALRSLYDQYKVLAIKVRFFPANVGIEPDSALFGPSNALFRGDSIAWTDQRFDTGSQTPTLISQVINNASARMVASRRPFSRVIYRGSGYPEWAQTVGPNTTDSWNGSVEFLINGATPSTATFIPVLWYYTVQYKVMVRGRHQP